MNERIIQQRWIEILVALCFTVIGILVVVDSLRIGNGWGSDGPESGYFIFYIGCLLVLGGLLVIAQTLKSWTQENGETSFAAVSEFKLMLMMLIPTCIYVVGVIFLGIYLASIIFVASFMIRLGKYSFLKSALVSISLAVILFLLFEIWFLISLPKGPVEAMLGF